MNNRNIDESETREEREEKLRKARKARRRNSTIRGILGMLGCMVVLVAAMYGGMTLYDKFSGGEDADKQTEAGDGDASGDPGESRQEGGETGDTVDVLSGAVVYSQAELDRKVEEAVASAQNEEAERVLNGIKESLSSGTTTVETLRPYYPNDIVVVSDGRFHFVPINRDLKLNQLDAANLQILENGEYQYLTDGQVTSHKGIDVSSHQGKIDWNLVAQDGVEFAIIRLGYRGYGKEGNLMEDAQFDANIQGAKAAGIKVGVYIFSQAINDDEVLAEAQLVLNKIAPYELDCPVVYDVERTSADGRMNNISVEERTHLTLLFCQTIENAGYTPMIYHNTQMGALMIDIAALEDYDKWYASYSDQMFYPYEYKIWQYSDKGRIQGIGTDVDLNICFEPVWN
ncbi:MAG: glycoside hydrolase family 25 protein [Butyrivibrio sp.]|nr:glycoside hydrolase family 25 protein [Acetatifactor muris]MCM1559057.1 glycoside hydrolase family 25 protein [Butyrivibrio sp.]